ncbi:UNVERIFIED_ORG: hypothetical protein FNL38_102291 [Nocardia globerula]|uniref:Uncharacterized protein n=1 Tax=Nocardia globerula TaxID=1818 RepID=A0A652YSQ3_NOCGL
MMFIHSQWEPNPRDSRVNRQGGSPDATVGGSLAAILRECKNARQGAADMEVTRPVYIQRLMRCERPPGHRRQDVVAGRRDHFFLSLRLTLHRLSDPYQDTQPADVRTRWTRPAPQTNIIQRLTHSESATENEPEPVFNRREQLPQCSRICIDSELLGVNLIDQSPLVCTICIDRSAGNKQAISTSAPDPTRNWHCAIVSRNQALFRTPGAGTPYLDEHGWRAQTPALRSRHRHSFRILAPRVNRPA